MAELRELLAAGLMVGGAFFLVVGTVGLLRMPDVYTRLHAAAKCDTLGAGLVLAGQAVLFGPSNSSLKLIVLILFIWITSPTAAHVMARAALRAGVAPVAGTAVVDLRDRRAEGERR